MVKRSVLDTTAFPDAKSVEEPTNWNWLPDNRAVRDPVLFCEAAPGLFSCTAQEMRYCPATGAVKRLLTKSQRVLLEMLY
jgi:hypothetical protein